MICDTSDWVRGSCECRQGELEAGRVHARDHPLATRRLELVRARLRAQQRQLEHWCTGIRRELGFHRCSMGAAEVKISCLGGVPGGAGADRVAAGDDPQPTDNEDDRGGDGHPPVLAPIGGGGGFRGCAPQRVYQVGASLALRLKFRANRLVKSGKVSLPGTAGASLLDPPVGDAVAALRRRRPMVCESLAIPSAPAREIAVISRQERPGTRRTSPGARERTAELMETVGLDLKATGAALSGVAASEPEGPLFFSDLYLTAVAHAALGESKR